VLTQKVILLRIPSRSQVFPFKLPKHLSKNRKENSSFSPESFPHEHHSSLQPFVSFPFFPKSPIIPRKQVQVLGLRLRKFLLLSPGQRISATQKMNLRKQKNKQFFQMRDDPSSRPPKFPRFLDQTSTGQTSRSNGSLAATFITPPSTPNVTGHLLEAVANATREQTLHRAALTQQLQQQQQPCPYCRRHAQPGGQQTVLPPPPAFVLPANLQATSSAGANTG
jgi:hypothetical protein